MLTAAEDRKYKRNNREAEFHRQQRHERRELEIRGREAARERTISGIMFRQGRMQDDDVPPDVAETLGNAQERLRLAEEEFRRIEREGDISN